MLQNRRFRWNNLRKIRKNSLALVLFDRCIQGHGKHLAESQLRDDS